MITTLAKQLSDAVQFSNQQDHSACCKTPPLRLSLLSCLRVAEASFSPHEVLHRHQPSNENGFGQTLKGSLMSSKPKAVSAGSRKIQ